MSIVVLKHGMNIVNDDRQRMKIDADNTKCYENENRHG